MPEKAERKFAETLESYLVAFFDVQGQRAKLRELRGLPRTREEYEAAGEILRATVGSVLELRRFFKMYFEGFMESVDALPPERRAKINEAVGYRGISDSFVISIPLRNEDEQLTPSIGLYACLLAACGAMTSSLASRRPLRGGIDVGLGMLIEEGEVYGPALERAYALESGVADHSRIIIGDELWRYLTALEGQMFNSAEGQVAKEVGRRAKELIVTDSDGFRILDYLGQHFLDMSGQTTRALVQPAYDFVVEQRRLWEAAKNEKLAQKYRKTQIYFDEHLTLWGVRESPLG